MRSIHICVGVLVLVTGRASFTFAQDAGTDPDAGLPPDAATPTPTPNSSALSVPVVVPMLPPPPQVPVAAPAKSDAVLEVTVVGTSAAKTAGSAHIIRSKQLERFEYDDPHAVMAQVPGVYSRGEDGVGLRPNIGLRGVNPDRSKKVTLMEDGILFGPAPYSAPAAYYFPLITRMSQVKVIKGPGSIAFGPQTVGGAIDLVTRSIPTLTAGGVDVALGQYGYGKAHAHAGTSDGKTGYVIEGIHLRDDGFKYLPNGTDIGFSRNEWMYKGMYRFDPIAGHDSRVQVKLEYGDEESFETYVGLTDAEFRRTPRKRYDATQLDRMQWFRTAMSVSHELQMSANATLTTTLYRNDLARTWRKVNGFPKASLFDVLTNPTDPLNQQSLGLLTGQADSASTTDVILIGPNQRTFISQGAQMVARWNPITGPVGHRFESGARLHFDSIERRHSEDSYFLAAGQLVPTGGPTNLTAFNRATTLATALHVTDAMTWRGLTITPGLRVELIHSTYLDRKPVNGSLLPENSRYQYAVLPGIGVYQSLTEGLGLLAGVHRGFSPAVPALRDDTRQEKSLNYEAGGRYSKGPLQAEVIGYFNDYQNLTDVCTFSSGCADVNLDRQFDAGKARIYGVEVYGRHEQRIGRFTAPLTLAYTRTHAHFDNTFTSEDPTFGTVTKGDEMPYVPRHLFNASAGVEHLRGGFHVSTTYVSAMRELAGSGPLSQTLATDRQFVADLAGQLRIAGPWVLYANVRNLFNEQFIVSRRPFGARPNIPRWVQVGLRATF